MSRSQQLTNVAPKQSPAPVGSTSSTSNPGCVRRVAEFEVAGAFSAALVNDRPDAVAKDFRDRGFLFFRLGEEIEFDAARQEEIATSKQGFACFPKAWEVQNLRAEVRVE